MRGSARGAVLALLCIGMADGFAGTGDDDPEAQVTLDARDADIHQIAEALSGPADLQVVFDPGIACRVSVGVRELPWRKVFRAALGACGLGYEDDGTVVRIARRETLEREAAHRAKLAEEQALRRPDRVRLFRLSYARAREMAPLIAKQLSGRARVEYDERTNTLIIID